MNTATLQPFARAGMLIRQPVATVFEAFIDPAVTTRFWFTKSTGRLDQHTEVSWTWEMYHHTTPVTVKTIEPDSRIVIEWGNKSEISVVEWTFKSISEGTFVEVTNNGFHGNNDAVLAQVRDSTEGFTLVLAGAKALLEHGLQLNLVADRFPAGLK